MHDHPDPTDGTSPGPTPTAAPEAEGDFCRDTGLTPMGDGRYSASIPDAWRVMYAFGGVSMAVAVRAIATELARDDLDLLSAHALFCAPVPCTDVEASAEVLRSGRSAAQGRADLFVAGSDEVAIAATATFGRFDASPVAYVDTTLPPEAGRPEDHEPPPPRDPEDPFPELPFHHQTDWRPAVGTRWWDDDDRAAWTPGPARAGSWMRLVREPLLPDGTFDPVALCVPGDTLGLAIGQHLGPAEEQHFFNITLELTLQVFARQTSAWVFQHVTAPAVGGGFGWGSVELFGEDGTLLAIADQRARLRFFAPGDGFLT